MSFVAGMILIDAPHSALNMLGTDSSMPDRNIMRVKKLKKGRNAYIYVSPQAWRFWWRNTLANRFNWELSPLFREEKQVFTSANPINYSDDDVFGYMRAFKKGKSNITVTRVSPLKNTPLISLFPERNSLTVDEGYASRHEGDPVPYSSEFYSTVLKGAFSIDLNSVGVFVIKDKAGFKNILKEDEVPSSMSEEYKEMKEEAEKLNSKISDEKWILPSEIRKKRVVETLLALKYLYGGAKLTEYLTDVTPKFIMLGMFEGGINPFISDIVYEQKGDIVFDKDALVSRISEFKDILNPKKIFIGKDKGFMKDWDSALTELKKDLEKNGITTEIVTIGKAIDGFIKEIEKYYE